MSCTEKEYSPAFKTECVLAALDCQKGVEKAAAEFDVPPELLSSWVELFLEKAPEVLGRQESKKLRKKIAEERREKEDYARKAEEMTRQLEWLKKVSRECGVTDFEKCPFKG